MKRRRDFSECLRQLKWLETEPKGFEENARAQADAGTTYEDIAAKWKSLGWPGPMEPVLESYFCAALAIEVLKHDHYVHLDVPDITVQLFDKTMLAITTWSIESKNRAMAAASRRNQI